MANARSPLREWALRLALHFASLLVALGLAETATRVFFPLNGGMDNVMLDGTPVTEWVAPSTIYRQISNEYDAVTTITSKGYRVTGREGEFTWGYGLQDEETFPSRYCTAMQVTCANLGIPGSGTVRQPASQILDYLRIQPASTGEASLRQQVPLDSKFILQHFGL